MNLNPTLKQKKAAKKIAENLLADKPEDLRDILEDVGYSKAIAKNPQMVTESVGFKKALNELGLTEELITTSLVEDIKANKGKRVPELRMGAEMLGMTKREDDTPKQQNTTYNFLFSSETQAEIAKIDAVIKQNLIKGHDRDD